MWKILQRNKKMVAGCIVFESVNTETQERRFSATINGWRNWRLLIVKQSSPLVAGRVIGLVRCIKQKIEDGDEEIFEQSNQAW